MSMGDEYERDPVCGAAWALDGGSRRMQITQVTVKFDPRAGAAVVPTWRKYAKTALAALVPLALRAVPRNTNRFPAGDPSAILVIRLDLLGDVLFSMQAVAGLRNAFPNARIDLMTLPYTAPLARLYTELDEVIEVDSNLIRSVRGLLRPSTWRSYARTLRLLRAHKYDLALSMAGGTASVAAVVAGAGKVVGYQDEAYRGTLTHALPGGRYRERKSEVEYVRALARAAGATLFPDTLSVPVPPASRQDVDALLAARGVKAEEQLVVIHAGAVNGSAKRWPARNWAEFASQLSSRSGARIVLAGAPSDRTVAKEVMQFAPEGTVDLVGQTDIPGLIALLHRADLVASGDSGPLHLANALRRPLLAVYGPTDPHIHGPFRPGAPSRLLRTDLPCSPCYSMAAIADCPLGDPICMRLVSVPRMVDAALELLGLPWSQAGEPDST